jgi:DNA replication and repair protein RecF
VVVGSFEPRGFRNLADATLPLTGGMTLFHGPNGAGKTNLLEALHFGLTGGSCRGGPDRDMIRFGTRTARVEVELIEPRAALLASIDRGGERRHLLDGQSLGPAPPNRPLVSVFLPDRLQLVKGPPAHRRALLDRFLAAMWPARRGLRQRFGHALAQRNALVSRIRAGLASARGLAAWDEKLAAEAAPLIMARSEATAALERRFAELCEALGLPGATLSYRPRAEADAGSLARELAMRRGRDLGRAYTSYGPQLDELELRFAGRLLRRFGSQGQQRVALLGLLLAQRRALIERGRPAPLMLLDDVMSELDPERRGLLVEALTGAGQALLTATEPGHLPRGHVAALIPIRDGGITRLEIAA